MAAAAQTTEQGPGAWVRHPADALPKPLPGVRSPPAPSFSGGTRRAAGRAPQRQSRARPAGAPGGETGAERCQERCRARTGSRAGGGAALPARAGAASRPPRAGRMGPALARRIKGGEQRSGGEHLSLSSGTSPDAFIWCRLSGELQLPTVSGVKLPHKAARGLGTAGLGGPGRAGGVPAAGPGPGQHQGAGPRQRRPRGVLPEGDRRAPAPRASAAAATGTSKRPK